MILSMPGQAWLFLSCVLTGAAIGVLYDFFRLIRKTVPHKPLVVQIEDVLFWVIATIGMFYFLLHRNFGEIRAFALIGALCGAVLYFTTLSRLMLPAATAIVNFLKRVIATAFRMIFMPFRMIFNFIAPPVKKFLEKRRKSLRSLSKYGKMRVRKSIRNWSIMRKKV